MTRGGSGEHNHASQKRSRLNLEARWLSICARANVAANKPPSHARLIIRSPDEISGTLFATAADVMRASAAQVIGYANRVHSHHYPVNVMPKKSATPPTTPAQKPEMTDASGPGQPVTSDSSVSAETESAAVNWEGPPAAELSEERKQAIFSELSWIAETWKRAIEKKDWSTLVDLIGLDEIFIKGHPENASRIASHLARLTRNLCDFEAVTGEFYRQQITEDRASFTFRLNVMWSSTEDWDEHLLDLVVHIGLKSQNRAWVTNYLLLDRASAPEVAAVKPSATQQTVADGDSHATNTQTAEAPPQTTAAGSSESSRLTDDQIAEAAAQYFARPSYGEELPPEPRRGKKQLIYVPVLMDADLIRDLLS